MTRSQSAATVWYKYTWIYSPGHVSYHTCIRRIARAARTSVQRVKVDEDKGYREDKQDLRGEVVNHLSRIGFVVEKNM